MALAEGDGAGAGVVVDHADVIDDEVTALDGEDAFVVGFVMAFGAGEGEVTKLGCDSVFDFDDGLVCLLLDDAARAEEAAAFTPDADLFLDQVVTRGDIEHAVGVSVQSGLNGGVVCD